jgi:hypothetical protein
LDLEGEDQHKQHQLSLQPTRQLRKLDESHSQVR